MAEILTIKPSIQELDAFDAYRIDEKGIEIRFSWNAFLLHECLLKVYQEDSLIYSSFYETMNLSYVISNDNAELLEILQYYQDLQSRIFITITAYSANREYQSMESEKRRLLLYDTPVVEIDNISDHMTIDSTSVTAAVTKGINFSQKQNIAVYSYRFILYNQTKTMELDASPELYYLKEEALSAEKYSYVFSLDNHTDYVLAIEGQLLGGLHFYKAYAITCRYNKTSTYQGLTLQNNPNGTITIDAEVTPIRYKSYPAEASLTYVDGSVDLTGNGAYVSYADGFSVHNDFVLHLKMRHIPCDTPIRILEGKSGYLELLFKRKTQYAYTIDNAAENYAFIYDGDKYVQDGQPTETVIPMLKISSGISESTIYAREIAYTTFSNENQFFHVMISRKNHLYGFVVESI